MIDEQLALLIEEYFESGAARQDMEAISMVKIECFNCNQYKEAPSASSMVCLDCVEQIERELYIESLGGVPIFIPVVDEIPHTEARPQCDDPTCPCWEEFEGETGWEWSDSANTFVISVLHPQVDLDARNERVLSEIYYDTKVEF